MTQIREQPAARVRVGQAAEMLGVSVETLRRWESEGRLRMERSEGGQRLVEIEEVARLLDERRKATTDRPIVAQSARNRFPASSPASRRTASPPSSRSSPVRTGWSAS